MFQNYFKIALRNIQKQKLNSVLNIIGLAVAIAGSLLILFHVKDELYVDGEIQMSKLKAIARLGGELYCRTRDIFEMNMLDAVQ